MMAVGWVANLFQRGITSLRRIHRVLDQRPVVVIGPTVPFPEKSRFTYACRNLGFTYEGATHPALDGINLEIGPGLVGMSYNFV